MKHPLSLAAALCAAALLLACDDSTADTLVVSQAQDGQAVELPLGRILVVELPGNPTTGFEWAVAENNDALLEPGESSYAAESDAIGAGGTFTFRFKAVAAGSAALRLAYRRSWESVPPEDTFTLTVTIPDPE